MRHARLSKSAHSQKLVVQATAVQRDLEHMLDAQRTFHQRGTRRTQPAAKRSEQRHQDEHEGQELRGGGGARGARGSNSSGSGKNRWYEGPATASRGRRPKVSLWYEGPPKTRRSVSSGTASSSGTAGSPSPSGGAQPGGAADKAGKEGGGAPPAAAAGRPSRNPLPFISVDREDMDAAIEHTFGAPPASGGGTSGTGTSVPGTGRQARWPPPIKTATNVLVVSAALMNRSNQVGRPGRAGRPAAAAAPPPPRRRLALPPASCMQGGGALHPAGAAAGCLPSVPSFHPLPACPAERSQAHVYAFFFLLGRCPLPDIYEEMMKAFTDPVEWVSGSPTKQK